MLPDIARFARISRSRALGLGFGLLGAATPAAFGTSVGPANDGGRLFVAEQVFLFHTKNFENLAGGAQLNGDHEVAGDLYWVSSSISDAITHLHDLYDLGRDMETPADRASVRQLFDERVAKAIKLLSKSVDRVDHESLNVRSASIDTERDRLRVDLKQAMKILQSLKY